MSVPVGVSGIERTNAGRSTIMSGVGLVETGAVERERGDWGAGPRQELEFSGALAAMLS